MSSAQDDRHALTLWELAQCGSPAPISLFARIVGSSQHSPRARHDGSPEALRQAWSRFHRWAVAHGLSIEKTENPDQAPQVEFDVDAALALATKLRPRLSREPVTKGAQRCQPVPTSAQESLTVKEAAQMLNVNERTLARHLRGKKPLVPFAKVGRTIRILKADVLAMFARDEKAKGR